MGIVIVRDPSLIKFQFFNAFVDHRRDLTKLHKLDGILLIGLISVICGADTYNEMENYASAKEGFLHTFLDLPNGIHSHDTFNRVFCTIDSQSWREKHKAQSCLEKQLPYEGAKFMMRLP